MKEYESPFATFGNNSIWFIDVNGDDTFKAFIFEKKWKNVYKTHLMGLQKNPQLVNSNGAIYLDYDPLKSNAIKRRRDAKKNIILPIPPNYDVDEFPYASTKQGGSNAAVNAVPRSENRSHGAYIGNIVKSNNMKLGDVFEIVLIPEFKKEKGTNPKQVPEFDPKLMIEPKIYGGYPGQGAGDLISDFINSTFGTNIKIPDPDISPIKIPNPVIKKILKTVK